MNRINQLEKLIAISKMQERAKRYLSGNIKDLQNAPSWWPEQFIDRMEKRIFTMNKVIARLESYYQNQKAKL